ncbi:unnamed protein product [Auanema sp. JU1783]|nr:unnamed protein product [Auanema sp. JU1783]
MGGRGRGGGAGTTVRAVANALGIARHEMASYQQSRVVEPPLYPVLNRPLIPLSIKDEQSYMSDVKFELVNRFHESEFFLDHKKKKDIRRYMDKYNQLDREKMQPDFTRLPDELAWQRDKGQPKAKKRKTDGLSNEELNLRLKRLEDNETDVDKDDDVEDEEEGSEKSDKEDPEVLSEDGYAEEDNDYISNYFDNGEGYGEGGSDDNLDGDDIS